MADIAFDQEFMDQLETVRGSLAGAYTGDHGMAPMDSASAPPLQLPLVDVPWDCLFTATKADDQNHHAHADMQQQQQRLSQMQFNSFGSAPPYTRPSSRCELSPLSASAASSHFSYPLTSSHPSSHSNPSGPQYLSQYLSPSSADHQQHVAQLLGVVSNPSFPQLHPHQQHQHQQHQHQQRHSSSSLDSVFPPPHDPTQGGASGGGGRQDSFGKSLSQHHSGSAGSGGQVSAGKRGKNSAAAASAAAVAAAAAMQSADRGMASHSSVEKQRRDRINSLIDELRDLVPPSPPVGPAASSLSARSSLDCSSAEAQRRPKHVVLADTIALVKCLRLDSQYSGALQMDMSRQPSIATARSPSGPEPRCSGSLPALPSRPDSPRGGSNLKTSSVLQPMLPHIPIAVIKFSGVHVEKGVVPGVMYLQVKCRDRPHLLADITAVLKSIPAEVTAAAVMTQDDGVAIDQFEIMCDDHSVDPAFIQNLVHDALYHQEYKKQRQ